MAGFNMDGYVPVNQRILKWYERYPEGRIVADPPELHQIGDRFFVGCTARAYRTVDDPQPCQGSAWEPFPGPTQFTRDSEAQNAETSAVGRALALAGIEVNRGMASQEEVRNRQPAAPTSTPVDRITAVHLEALKERLYGLPENVKDQIRPLVNAGPKLAEMTADQTGQAEAFLDLIEADLQGVSA